MELKLPPVVSLTATINGMYSDAGDIPLNPAGVIRAAESAPEGVSGLSARNPA
jgi:hypothetical protein